MEKIKWGVIGGGGIADRRTIPGMLMADNAVLTAVMDRNTSHARAVGEKYNVSGVCDSVEELLKQDIDAVYIATPVFCHKEQAVAAMRAGKHVLCEKPMALSREDCSLMVQTARQTGMQLMIGQVVHYRDEAGLVY